MTPAGADEAEKTEAVIVCEGYHDRAFWAGLLLRSGCTDPGAPSVQGGRRPKVKDPGGKPVEGGQFGFRTPAGGFIRVVPAHGNGALLGQALGIYLPPTRVPRARLVVCSSDADTIAGSKLPEPTLNGLELTHAAGWQLQGHWFTRTADDPRLAVTSWACADPPGTPGVPAKQTLERVVCAALAEVFPARAKAVQEWLDSRPAPPAASPKAHAWSYMAGWHPEKGCEAFLQLVWDPDVVPGVAEAIETRLRASGAWPVIEQLVATGP